MASYFSPKSVLVSEKTAEGETPTKNTLYSYKGDEVIHAIGFRGELNSNPELDSTSDNNNKDSSFTVLLPHDLAWSYPQENQYIIAETLVSSFF